MDSAQGILLQKTLRDEYVSHSAHTEASKEAELFSLAIKLSRAAQAGNPAQGGECA